MSGALLVATAWTQTESGWRIDTFAGLPKSGDGGPATEAQLNYPAGVAVDGAGNLYIVDSGNNRIRKVDSSGTITTIAGFGNSSGLVGMNLLASHAHGRFTGVWFTSVGRSTSCRAEGAVLARPVAQGT